MKILCGSSFIVRDFFYFHAMHFAERHFNRSQANTRIESACARRPIDARTATQLCGIMYYVAHYVEQYQRHKSAAEFHDSTLTLSTHAGVWSAALANRCSRLDSIAIQLLWSKQHAAPTAADLQQPRYQLWLHDYRKSVSRNSVSKRSKQKHLRWSGDHSICREYSRPNLCELTIHTQSI